MLIKLSAKLFPKTLQLIFIMSCYVVDFLSSFEYVKIPLTYANNKIGLFRIRLALLEI